MGTDADEGRISGGGNTDADCGLEIWRLEIPSSGVSASESRRERAVAGSSRGSRSEIEWYARRHEQEIRLRTAYWLDRTFALSGRRNLYPYTPTTRRECGRMRGGVARHASQQGRL